MVLENSFGPCDFVLFGTKGDLARRKLLPSLYQLEKARIPENQAEFDGRFFVKILKNLVKKSCAKILGSDSLKN